MSELASEEAHQTRLSALVQGRVQGVGFRMWVRDRASELQLRGSVANLAGGGVEIVAEGSHQSCAILLDLLHGDQTPGQVSDVSHAWAEPIGAPDGFRAR